MADCETVSLCSVTDCRDMLADNWDISSLCDFVINWASRKGSHSKQKDRVTNIWLKQTRFSNICSRLNRENNSKLKR